MEHSNFAGIRWGFLGGGRMASALVGGMIDAGLVAANQMIASDPSQSAREAISQRYGIRVTPENHEVVHGSDVILVAVKPQVLSGVLESLATLWSENHLLISIAAGVTLQSLDESTSHQPRLIRVMPNTPALVRRAATAYCRGPRATEADSELVGTIFQAVGLALEVPERLLDAVTGLSGSGPAFVAMLIEAMSDGGVSMGLPRDVAGVLARHTVLGTASMLEGVGQTPPPVEHPALLKDMVTSPGGTTIAGVHALERAGFRATVMDAVEAATRRSEELGRE